MGRNDPLASVSTRRTPQSRPAGGATTRNSAGGFVFATGDDVQLQRFLVLGTAGGTYYAQERELTAQNTDLVLAAARTRGRWLVDQALAVSEAGRAPKQHPALFAHAAVAAHGDDDARAYALDTLPRIARTGSTLFTWAGYVENMRGWGRGLRKAVARWYTGTEPATLAYQLVKYRQRDGWTHRDLLRLAHPDPGTSAEHAALFRWAVGREAAERGGDALPEVAHSFTLAQEATTVPEWVRVIEGAPSISWEMLPDAALGERDVWAKLLERNRVPIGALVRQLPRLTKLGLTTGDTAKLIHAKLTDAETLKRGRMHPVKLLVAQKTYAAGRGRGSSWSPDRHVVDALDAAFYNAFGAVTPSGGRTLVALDVSGSMGWSTMAGLPLTAREGSAAMALVTLATEERADVVGFTSGTTSGRGYSYGSRRSAEPITELDITPRRRLDDVLRYVDGLDFGGTDCALPMLWATARGQGYDHFVIYTDNETWAGAVHPHQALTEHRDRLNPAARLTVVGMTSTGFSIADPTDPGQMDVVGFDTAAPQLIADFGGGRL